MAALLWSAFGLLVALIAGLVLRRRLDLRDDRRISAALAATRASAPACFDPRQVTGLPEPARRYFRFVMATGTPLHSVAEIEMTGRFSLGTRERPNWLSMSARQTLAGPRGLVWRMSARRGWLCVSGSDALADGISWTRFWLGGVAPMARLGGTLDHRRSAFGRAVAEAVFWAPATLLPGPGIVWSQMGPGMARVSVSRDGMEQTVDITVAADGRPTQVAFLRWSNANAAKAFRLQPFGGVLSEFREFGGFHLPTHVEAGNQFGTPACFPFYVAEVERITFSPAPVP